MESGLMARLQVDDNEYPCSFNNDAGFVRGTALIITMGLQKQEGVNVEKAHIKDVLGELLRFEILEYSDPSADFIKEEINALAADDKHQSRDCFVCFINAIDLKDGCIFDNEGCRIYILADVIQPFRQSQALRNKPKVFFVNASRDARVKGPEISTESSSSAYNNIKKDDVNRADVLGVYCTFKGPSSWREPDEGSMYIKFLAHELIKNHNTTHLVNILQNVYRAVHAELTRIKEKNCSPNNLSVSVVIESTLTKKLYWRTIITQNSKDSVSFPKVPGAPELIFIRFEKLKFEEKIGEGSFGEVKRAVLHGYPVAAKTVSSVVQLKKEVIRVPPDPHVLTIFGYTRDAQEPDKYWLVMEKMKTDLHQLIEQRMIIEQKRTEQTLIEKQRMKRKMKEQSWIEDPLRSVEPFTFTQAVDVLLQIAKGMEHLHRNSVVHRDLKPRNVLVNYDDDGTNLVVKIADFGTSKPNFNPSDPNQHTLWQGTPVFMAPEMRGNGAEVGEYSSMVDVYSYGITCIQIVTGILPEVENSPQLEHPLFDFVVRECCRKKPGDRPSFSEICEWLEKLKTFKSIYYWRIKSIVIECCHEEPRNPTSFGKICHFLEGLKRMEEEELKQREEEKEEEEKLQCLKDKKNLLLFILSTISI